MLSSKFEERFFSQMFRKLGEYKHNICSAKISGSKIECMTLSKLKTTYATVK